MSNIKPEKLLIEVWEESIREDSDVKVTAKFFPYAKGCEENHRLAVILFKHVFSVLEWTPHDVMNFMSQEIISLLHLESAYSQLIFPPEVSPRSNPSYIAKICYPDKLPELSQENLWLMNYQKILSSGRFKRDFFLDKNRYKKACLFLNWYLVNHPQKGFDNLEAAYHFFASEKAMPFLKKIKLDKPCEQLFASPLEYFHNSLPEDGDEYSKNNDLYAITDFRRRLRELREK